MLFHKFHVIYILDMKIKFNSYLGDLSLNFKYSRISLDSEQINTLKIKTIWEYDSSNINTGSARVNIRNVGFIFIGMMTIIYMNQCENSFPSQ